MKRRCFTLFAALAVLLLAGCAGKKPAASVQLPPLPAYADHPAPCLNPRHCAVVVSVTSEADGQILTDALKRAKVPADLVRTDYYITRQQRLGFDRVLYVAAEFDPTQPAYREMCAFNVKSGGRETWKPDPALGLTLDLKMNVTVMDLTRKELGQFSAWGRVPASDLMFQEVREKAAANLTSLPEFMAVLSGGN